MTDDVKTMKKRNNANDVSPKESQSYLEEKDYMRKYESSLYAPTHLSKTRVFFLNISWFGMNVMYLILSVEVVPSQIHALVGSEMKGQVFGAMVALGLSLS